MSSSDVHTLEAGSGSARHSTRALPGLESVCSNATLTKAQKQQLIGLRKTYAAAGIKGG